MKPSGWTQMMNHIRRGYAMDLLKSMRGQLIVSQALVRAIEVMKKERFPETSNIQDMEILLEELFPLFAGTSLAFEKLLERNRPAALLPRRTPPSLEKPRTDTSPAAERLGPGPRAA